MLKISKLADYGTVIMFHMAQRPEAMFSASEVAAAIGVPLPTVGKIMKMLARRHLLFSRRGVHGGYLLARPPREISVAEILEAIEGQLSLTDCGDGRDHCRQSPFCRARTPWQRINQAVRATLQSVTLEDRETLAMPLRVDVCQAA